MSDLRRLALWTTCWEEDDSKYNAKNNIDTDTRISPDTASSRTHWWQICAKASGAVAVTITAVTKCRGRTAVVSFATACVRRRQGQRL